MNSANHDLYKQTGSSPTVRTVHCSACFALRYLPMIHRHSVAKTIPDPRQPAPAWRADTKARRQGLLLMDTFARNCSLALLIGLCCLISRLAMMPLRGGAQGHKKPEWQQSKDNFCFSKPN